MKQKWASTCENCVSACLRDRPPLDVDSLGLGFLRFGSLVFALSYCISPGMESGCYRCPPGTERSPCGHFPWATLLILVGHRHFLPGVTAASAASLPAKFPLLFIAQGVVVSVYGRYCFHPGMPPSGGGATLDGIGVRGLKHLLGCKGGTCGFYMRNSSVTLFVEKNFTL